MKQKSNFNKFLLLWFGELVSSIGSGLTAFGLGVYIFKVTGSAASMALVTLLGFLPSLLLSVPAGILADRYDRRLLMMIGDGFSALGVLFILICMIRGEATLFQICIGVSVSAIFSALLEPSYRATITDLLTAEEFSRANGLVSLAGSSRYLFSPLIAGFLLTISDVKLLLIIDIATFLLTVTGVAVVRKGIGVKETEVKEAFFDSIKSGWKILRETKGLLALVSLSSVITLFMGMFQTLVKPLILSFQDEKTLGIAETVCACGMLVSGVILGIKGIKKNYVTYLALSLSLSGLCMFGFGLFENIIPVCTFGFLFFLVLPVANNCMDYLARTNIPADKQGRVWGLIGFISQLGYVVSYAVSGVMADALGKIGNRGVGRGSALLIIISGLCLTVFSLGIFFRKNIKSLEHKEVIYEIG